MNFEKARFNMVEQQVRPWEVLNPRVLDILGEVKREDFVPPRHRKLAFADLPIPLDHGEFMMKPVVEGRLLQALELTGDEEVLEIGTGSGYMAALLAARAEHVVTVENRPALVAVAKQNFERAGITNVTIELGDGGKGWSQRGPFDAIVVSGSIPAVPDALLKQLRVGGRLAVVVGEAPVMEAQLITCTADGIYNTVNLFETVIPALDGVAAKESFFF